LFSIAPKEKKRVDKARRENTIQKKQQPSHKRKVEASPTSQPKKRQKEDDEDDPYGHLDPELASQLRKEDAEIAELEGKLGLADSKEKKRLHKEYAKEEGYGDDFGDFLDDLDKMVYRLQSSKGEVGESGDEDFDDDDDDDNSMPRPYSSSESSDESDDEEEVPMKLPQSDDEVDQQKDDKITARSDEVDEDHDDQDDDRDDSSSNDGSDSALEDNEDEPHHNAADTYKPSEGEDIYGNTVEASKDATKLSKYVPPHMRNQSQSGGDKDDKAHQESLQAIRRALNNALNRLSEDTLVSVAQSIARLYASHPTAHVNECIWKNTRNACVARSFVMTGLTPVYAAALVGVHLQKGDAAQLGEHLIEMTVTDLFKQLPLEREQNAKPNALDREAGSDAKEASNLVLLLCYLYNFDLAHCSLIYDVIRDLIKNFKEVDVELLLIILSHCGRSLRSDDPSSLKEIVLEVQKRVMECKDTFSNASRVDFMVSAVMDLKNNKKRKQDAVFGDKTSKLRKLIGRVKAAVASGGGTVRSGDSSSSLRIKLKDILEAESKGRWWKVGASWEGNQYKFQDGGHGGSGLTDEKVSAEEKEEESKLLRLAAKYRMNTDTRRSIFCIIMGSADFEDAFEKLVKAGMLKNKTERDTARVLMECCGNEKTYNSFYEHLANRICEYQSQCKFTFQLAYWDSFKQFESMKPRKAANLAKLLYALVVKHRLLKMNVLKGIDMTSPEDLSEIGMIFLTLFFTNILDHFDDPSDVASFFESGMTHRQTETNEEEEEGGGETEALYASLTLFLVQIMKSSPKYAKGSKYRANLKAAIKACDADNFFM